MIVQCKLALLHFAFFILSRHVRVQELSEEEANSLADFVESELRKAYTDTNWVDNANVADEAGTRLRHLMFVVLLQNIVFVLP